MKVCVRTQLHGIKMLFQRLDGYIDEKKRGVDD